jgi:hypothetical protein
MGIHGIFHTRLSIGKEDMGFYYILHLICVVMAINQHMRLRFKSVQVEDDIFSLKHFSVADSSSKTNTV